MTTGSRAPAGCGRRAPTLWSSSGQRTGAGSGLHGTYYAGFMSFFFYFADFNKGQGDLPAVSLCPGPEEGLRDPLSHLLRSQLPRPPWVCWPWPQGSRGQWSSIRKAPTPHLTLPGSCSESLPCFPAFPSTNRRAATQGVTCTGSSPQAHAPENTTASQPAPRPPNSTASWAQDPTAAHPHPAPQNATARRASHPVPREPQVTC